MDLIARCAEAARARPGRIVFPDSLDERAILAAARLAREGWAQPILLGNPFALRAFCLKKGLRLTATPIIDPATSPLLDRFVQTYAERRPNDPPEEIRAQMADPLWFGAALVEHGIASHCIAGNLATTAAVLRAGLRVIGLAEGNKTVSSIFFMLPPESNGGDGRILGFGDCGVVPCPTVEQLADIAISGAESFRNVTGEAPRVAMLSFSSHGSARHPDAQAVRAAAELVRARRADLVVDGELQFDAACVPSVAAQKVPDSPLSGKANVFIFPSLAAGNIGYKIAQRLGGYSAIGPMIQGLKRPMHDLSRGCSTEDMVEVSLVAMKMAPPTAARNEAGTAH
ncbi:MAG: phosphate acetyltransferase [Candidatus Accumulibacter sp.]|jgi:phosphotransacetylase|nr:phosphate acetyltransferase [Accumulibacter sp.]